MCMAHHLIALYNCMRFSAVIVFNLQSGHEIANDQGQTRGEKQNVSRP